MSEKIKNKIIIPFNKPYIDGQAIDHIKKVFKSNKLSETALFVKVLNYKFRNCLI